MVRIVKKERRIIVDDLLPWIRREQKVQWFILCFIVVLIGAGIWFLAQPSPKQDKPVATPSVVNAPTPAPTIAPTPVQPKITIAPAEVKPSTPPAPQAAQSVRVLPEPEAPVIRTQPPTPAYGNFPPDRVIMRHMIIVPASAWDENKRYFFDRQRQEYFITPPNVYLFNGAMRWTSPFNGFAEKYWEQGRIFRAQAANEPPIYVNWRAMVDKYGERARPPMGR